MWRSDGLMRKRILEFLDEDLTIIDEKIAEHEKELAYWRAEREKTIKALAKCERFIAELEGDEN